jgi:hypothetical protein
VHSTAPNWNRAKTPIKVRRCQWKTIDWALVEWPTSFAKMGAICRRHFAAFCIANYGPQAITRQSPILKIFSQNCERSNFCALDLSKIHGFKQFSYLVLLLLLLLFEYLCKTISLLSSYVPHSFPYHVMSMLSIKIKFEVDINDDELLKII